MEDEEFDINQVKRDINLLNNKVDNLNKTITRQSENMDNFEERVIKQNEKLMEENIHNVIGLVMGRVKTFVYQTIQTDLSKEGVRDIIKAQITNTINTNDFQEIIKTIIDRVLETMKKTLEREYKFIKQLSYSIDIELKKIARDLPCNSKDTEMMLKRITTISNGIGSEVIKQDKTKFLLNNS